MGIIKSVSILFLYVSFGSLGLFSFDLQKDIKLPLGFYIEEYADELPRARSLRFNSDKSILYIGSFYKNVYALNIYDKNITILANNLEEPVGVAYKNGDLYISDISKILKIENVDNNLTLHKDLPVIYGKLPDKSGHEWRYIGFGPDGKLYIAIGAPCNICNPKNRVFASISRIDDNGTNFEVYASGIRNSVGFDWDKNGYLWFSVNGRDWMGDNIPPDALSVATKQGLNFGFPYIHGKDIKDPIYGNDIPKNYKFTPPALTMQAHSAPLGMRFYNARMFPKRYQGGIFLARHGSWNRSKKVGYDMLFIKTKGDRVLLSEIFARGWLQQDKNSDKVFGRPVDVVVAKDGSLLVSDDLEGKIYRIYYKEPTAKNSK